MLPSSLDGLNLEDHVSINMTWGGSPMCWVTGVTSSNIYLSLQLYFLCRLSYLL